MIDEELTVELVCEMYDEKILVLKKEIDRLNEEVQALNLQIQKEKENNSHIKILKLQNYIKCLESINKDLFKQVENLEDREYFDKVF